jgi:hypothetical protein
MKIRLYETVARYLLGVIYLFGAVDGALAMFFGIHLSGEPNPGSFLGVLSHTMYFWVFLKSMEFVGAMSLLLNYKPALGTALMTPISAVLCLFYVFDLHWYYAFTIVATLNLVLLRAYWSSYRPMLDAYPMRGHKTAEVAGIVEHQASDRIAGRIAGDS